MFKKVDIVKQRYRYEITIYGENFLACTVLTQITINDGNTLLNCRYWGPYSSETKK